VSEPNGANSDIVTEGTRHDDPEGMTVRRGRIIYSKGPIIRSLEVLTVLTGLLAVGALIYTITALSTRVSLAQFDAAQAKNSAQAAELRALKAQVAARTARAKIVAIQTARYRAAEDNCFLLRGLVFAAATPHTSREARNYIDSTKLRDCHAYALAIEHSP
jgi:cell division protein FtsL